MHFQRVDLSERIVSGKIYISLIKGGKKIRRWNDDPLRLAIGAKRKGRNSLVEGGKLSGGYKVKRD